MKHLVLIFYLFLLSTYVFSQVPTNQDCNGAIPICQNVYSQGTAYSGTGNIPNEINSVPSCLGSGEKNDVWYTFTTQTAGNVCFSITPNTSSDDYDWAVYNLTNNNCSDIYNNAALEVSCNYSGTSGVTGPNGNTGVQNNPCIAVAAGQTYVVNVSQFSTSTSGYTINFGASSATIFDNVAPFIQSVNTPIVCGATTLSFNFSENILCSTVQDADFTLTGPGGPYVISAATGANCAAGGTQENTITVTVTPALTIAGAYQICLTNTAGSVTDLCGNVAPPACLNFNITNTVIANAGPDVITCMNAAGNIIPVTIGGTPTASGGSGSGYTYSWSPTVNLSNTTISNPSASPLGNTAYTVTVTDGVGCAATDVVNVTINNLNPPNMSSTPETCVGANDGTATATPINGTPGYSYSWSSTSQTTNPATNLSPGTYNVTVIDANGCGATNSVTIVAGVPILAGFTPPTAQCLTGNSYAFTNTGTTGVTYAWNFGDAGTSTLENPSHTYATAGTYTVTQIVTSGACSATFTATITVNPMPVPLATSTPALCNGGATGTATVTTPITPGLGPFTYSWSNGQTSNPATGLAAGSYTVVVTDQTTNCTGQVTIAVTQPTPVTATETHVNPSCAGGNNGTATATSTGGTSGYTYSWNTSPAQTTQTATGLTAGTYIATVTDANGCITTINATLVDPPGMVLSSTMTQANCGQADGSATVNVTSGGSGSFSYSWNTTPIQITATASNIVAGTYIATVTDIVNGCVATNTITVTTTAGITASTTLINNALCNGSTNGQASATPVGGTSPYTYSWNTTPVQATSTVTAGVGTYTVVITDANGCIGNNTVTITEPTPVVASIPVSVNVFCAGASNGTATAAGTGGTPGYAYQWNAAAGNQTTSTATGLAAGTYIVTVADLNGCSDTASVTILDGSILTSTVVGTDATCFGGSSGAINFTPIGGTAPYTYNWSNGSTTEDPTGLTAGNYTVTATDFNGCTVNDAVTINEPTAVVAIIDSVHDVACNGYSDGEAFASASGGTPGYTYQWDAAASNQITATATTLPFGTFSLTVTDTNGCIATIVANINQPPALTATTGSIPAYCALGQGTVWVNPTNGSAPYTYAWDSSATIIGNTDSVTNLYPSTYNLLLTDLNGCKFNTSVTVAALPGGTATISSFTDVSCNGGNDGSATVSVGGAFPGYIYQWDAAAGNQTSNPAINLAIGSYNVTVTDTFGCVMTTSVNIAQPPILSSFFIVNEKICPDSCNATVAANPSGGTPPYAYLWNDPNTQISATAINLCSATYSVTITDALNCTFTDSAAVNNPPKMIITKSFTSANCNQADGSANAIVSANGIPPYTYQWSDGINVVGNSSTLANVVAGTYFVTAFDSLGCSVIDTVTIPNLSGPSLVIDSVFNVLCFGDANGYAVVSVTGGVFPYTYLWTDPNAQTTPSASNLTAGNYTVSITDSNGCVVSTAINIAEPTQLQLTFGGTDPSCFTYNNGSTWVNTTGGTTPYTYNWNTAPTQANDTAFALTAGSYTATVTDSNGCFTTANVILTDPLLFSVLVTGNNVSCNSVCDGTASTTLTNGITPYTYLWDDPSAQTTNAIIGLCADTVGVIVTDAMGCVATDNIIITEPNLLVMTENTHGNVSCSGGNDGFSSVNVTGGTGPYNYLWDLAGNTVSTSQGANNLTIGSYLVTVTDANGCTDQITVVITEPNPLSAAVTPTDAACNGANTGSAFASPTGGVTPYTYQWTDAALQQTDTAFNLLAGNYTVTITDSLSCIFTINNIVINEPAPLTVNTSTVSSTCGNNNGAATVSVGGGTPNYSYQWNDPSSQSTVTASALLAGNYVVIVTDANGCLDSATANVTDLGSPTVNIPITTDVSCSGANDGTANSTVSGGTSPYSYVWNTGNLTDTLANVTGLAGQTYSITVTDANGCIASASTTIIENSGLSAAITSFTNVSCNGLSDGGATVLGGGGGAPYTYSWNTSPTQATVTANNLAAGSYIATITDTNGCTAVDTAIITEPTPLLITSFNVDSVKCFGASDGLINVTVNGGTQGYSYNWTPNISSGNTAAGITAGNYMLTVTDANGCTTNGVYDVFEPNQLVIDTITTPSTCGQSNGSATVTINTNSTPSYTYSWNDPNNQTVANATNLAASTYTVTVTDANGCFVTQNVVIYDLSGPIIDSIVVSPISCNGGSDGTATIYSSGNAPFTYAWNDPFNQTTQTATGLSASPPIFTVVITDVNNCFSTGTATIIEPTPLSVFINAPDTICFGESIQLFANANGGTSPYNYLWGGGQNGQGPIVAIPNSSAVYFVTVLDGSPVGCQASATKTVIVRSPLVVNAPDISICQGDVAIVPASSSGGNPNNSIQFFWMAIDSTSLALSPTGVTNPVNPLSVNPSITTNYIVYVNDGCSINDTVGVKITVNDTATGQLVPVIDACLGTPQVFNLTTDIGTSFAWDFNSDGTIEQTTTTTGNTSTTTYTYASAGTYDVTVTITTSSTPACVSTITALGLATANSIPVADFTTFPSPPIVTLINPTFNFIDQSMGANSWFWTFGDLTTDSINQNPSHTYQDTGFYTVNLLVSNSFGCLNQTNMVVQVKPDFFFAIPNTFTPDGDGLNDFFNPGAIVGMVPKSYSFYIFDRWGELIFEGHDLSSAWDGTVKGGSKIAQTGVYVWKIDITDFEGTLHKYIGHVNLLK